ncbi:MAG: GAF domain-containing protein [Chitinispirillaceae bacterium]|nr:GAF domain-containing protein [Chitinispirillaceae bacterium]
MKAGRVAAIYQAIAATSIMRVPPAVDCGVHIVLSGIPVMRWSGCFYLRSDEDCRHRVQQRRGAKAVVRSYPTIDKCAMRADTHSRLAQAADADVIQAKQISDITRKILEKKYFKDLFTFVLTVMAQATGAQFLAVFIIDKKINKPGFHAVYPASGLMNKPRILKFGKIMAAKVAAADAPAAIIDIGEISRYSRIAVCGKGGIVSLLSIPMHGHGEVIGAAHWYTTERYSFSKRDITTFAGIAEKAAAVIRDTELLLIKAANEMKIEKDQMIDHAKRLLASKKGIGLQTADVLLQRQSEKYCTPVRKIAESFSLAWCVLHGLGGNNNAPDYKYRSGPDFSDNE